MVCVTSRKTGSESDYLEKTGSGSGRNPEMLNRAFPLSIFNDKMENEHMISTWDITSSKLSVNRHNNQPSWMATDFKRNVKVSNLFQKSIPVSSLIVVGVGIVYLFIMIDVTRSTFFRLFSGWLFSKLKFLWGKLHQSLLIFDKMSLA